LSAEDKAREAAVETDENLQVFRGYTEEDVALIQSFADKTAKGSPGFITDFMGIKIRTENLWKAARDLDGQVLGIPVPADFHAEALEWVGVLRSVRSAKDQYVAMELGAGFGPWLVAGATGARRQGIRNIRLYGVEGDPKHYQALREHFSDNGIDPVSHELYEGAAAVQDGTAYWPGLQEDEREVWGNRPEQRGLRATYWGASGIKLRPITSYSVAKLLCKEPLWDLVHIDVQGHEVAICQSCLPEFNRRVRRIVVGTHSRKLDGDMLALLYGEKWILENEKPTKFVFRTDVPSLEGMTTVDGTQVWLNPRR
jgi:hypothetical protein